MPWAAPSSCTRPRDPWDLIGMVPGGLCDLKLRTILPELGPNRKTREKVFEDGVDLFSNYILS